MTPRALKRLNPGPVAAAVTSLLPAAVAGDSMLPSLRDGDLVLVGRSARCRPGDVIAVRDPRLPSRVVVKRAVRRQPGGWEALGDNPGASTDSRTFGPVPVDLVVGRVLLRYWPWPRLVARWRWRARRSETSDHLMRTRATAPRATRHRRSTWP